MQADQALVFIFSGLKESFHQPVGMFASRGTTPSVQLSKLVIAAITAIEKAGGKVMAIVSDGAQTNRNVWTEFGIRGKVDEETVYSFTNPFVNSRQVFVISDVPHLFKCIRNNLYTRTVFKVNKYCQCYIAYILTTKGLILLI